MNIFPPHKKARGKAGNSLAPSIIIQSPGKILYLVNNDFVAFPFIPYIQTCSFGGSCP